MAQWWHSGLHLHSLHHHFASSHASRSFLWEDLVLPKRSPDNSSPDKSLASAPACPSVSCFRDDDPMPPEHFLDKDASNFGLRTKLEIRYSPWAMSMMNGFGKSDPKEFTGGPTGGGAGGNDDDWGDGGGGGGDEGGDEQIFYLPLLTIAFAAFHLGYCIAVWLKDETLDSEFFRTGVGLFCLLAVAAIRLNNRTGIDAYILGWGASVGVMLWTASEDRFAAMLRGFSAANAIS